MAIPPTNEFVGVLATFLMKKLTKWEKVFVAVFIIAMIVTALNIFYPLQISSEMIVLSLSSVEYVTDDPLFAHKSTWLVNFVTPGGGEMLSGLLDVDKLKDGYPYKDGVGESKNGFRFYVQSPPDTCTYSLERKHEINQFTIKWKRYVSEFLLGDPWVACKESGGNRILIASDWKVWCIREGTVGWAGDVSHIYRDWEVRMTLAVDGEEPIEKTIKSKEYKPVMFGDIGRVDYYGSLVTREDCPPIGDRYPTYQETYGWRLADGATYRAYETSYSLTQHNFRECDWRIKGSGSFLPALCDADKLEYAIIGHNRKVEALLASDEKIDGTQVVREDSLYLTMAHRVRIPSFTLRILADVLRIEYYNANPKIVKEETYCDPDNTETSQGKLYVKVRNEGHDGSVNVVVSCEDSFVGSFDSPFPLGKDKTKTITIPVALTKHIGEDTKVRCRVVAHASNPDIRDDYSFYCKWKNFVGCTIGELSCSEDHTQVTKCTARGWIPVESCKHGCINGKCRDSPQKCNIKTHENCEDDEICVLDIFGTTYCRELKCKSDEIARSHQCVKKAVAVYPLLWALIFAVIGFVLSGYLLTPMDIEEARKRMATLLFALLFALIPFGLTYAGVELPDIQTDFLVCECAEALPVQIARMLGIPLDAFIWVLSVGLGVIAGIISYAIIRDMGFGRAPQILIFSIVSVIVWKLVCTTFWIGMLIGSIILVVGLVLVIFFPEVVAHWGVRFAKGGLGGLKR